MKNNKLIAEFMGLSIKAGVCYYTDENNEFPMGIRSNDNLPYDTSWDWLMPVIQKCIRTGDNTDEWDNIFDALSLLSINAVYEEVVEFIKDYNTGEIK